jgi:transposase
MPRPGIDMRKIREVLRLALGEELSRRQVAAASGVPLTTVGDYLRRAAAADLKWPLPGSLDDAGLEALLYPPAAPSVVSRPVPDWDRVHKELRRKGVTLQLLWVEYREAHPGDGYGYSQFANLYRSWRNGIDVSMRQAHAPGEKLFVDFPGDTFPVYDPATGQIALKAELFVAVLGASGYLYAEAFPSQELQYWVTAHVHCFEALGGCPAIVVSDNLRSAVTTADRYEPDVNATFAEMAAHYGVAVIPARPYKPKDKPKAESGVLLAERWIIARLRGRKFTSLGEANAAIAGCAAEINARPFQKLDGSRQELFGQIDRPALRPLPASPRTGITTRCLTGWPASRSTCGCRRPRSRSSTAGSGSPRTRGRWCGTDTPPSPGTCPSPTGGTPSGRRSGSPSGPLRPGRPPRRWRRRSWIPARIPSRATGPCWASSAWPAATATTAPRPPAPGRWRCARTPTAASSRS